MMHFTPKMVRELRRRYKKAVENAQESFLFPTDQGDQELLTSYAKYLLEYLETQFPEIH